MNFVVAIALGAIVSALLSFWFATRLFARLKSNHPEVWNRMGNPTLLRTSSISASEAGAMTQFILKREDKKLDDAKVSDLTRAILILWFMQLVLLVLFGWFGVIKT